MGCERRRRKQIHGIESFLKTAYLVKRNLQTASNDAIKHSRNIPAPAILTPTRFG